MGRLRDYWLEALSTCVTVVLVGFVYAVLAGYAAGPHLSVPQAAGGQHAAVAENALPARRAAR